LHVGYSSAVTSASARNKLVEDVVDRLVAALEPEDVVIGGGNVIHMKKLPRGCRAGNNAHAFIGGFRIWNDELEGRRLRASAENFGPSKKGSALFSNLNSRRKN
jgi:predicted NBD/HSP70 family sugar kinase